MGPGIHLAVDLGIILAFFAGIRQFRTPAGAARGNLTGAAAMACAAAAVLWRHPVLDPAVVAAAFAAGGLAGWIVALRVHMIQIPAMVAFQHGCGGIAASLVSFVELARGAGTLPLAGRLSGLLGLFLGAATFSGSMVAAAKLANRMRQTPMVLPAHNAVLASMTAASLALAALGAAVPSIHPVAPAAALGIVSAALGALFAVRIGGADMPVLISFLNASAGFAAALCGIVIQNRLLIACGAVVAASGSILTHIMCRSMNRGLAGVFAGIGRTPAKSAPPPQDHPAPADQVHPAPQGDPMDRAVEILRSAKTVIVIPGYGMALAQAQFETVRLAETLRGKGVDVKFAVHPVAGRMPGHMHVLLAEAEVDPDLLFEMDQVNDRFKQTDLVLVVGACDVVNPSAIRTQGTPISGMPILLAHEARHVIVCNLDDRPGYSGVENPLYDDPKTLLLLGDAKATVGEILRRLAGPATAGP